MVPLMNFSIPADCHILFKENEKTNKCQDLRIELERIWHKKTSVAPILIGALGAYSKKFTFYVNLQGMKYIFPSAKTFHA